eukprot:1012039-Rhodomonas_salina.3
MLTTRRNNTALDPQRRAHPRRGRLWDRWHSARLRGAPLEQQPCSRRSASAVNPLAYARPSLGHGQDTPSTSTSQV